MNRLELEFMRATLETITSMYSVQLDTIQLLLDIASNPNVYSQNLAEKLTTVTQKCQELSEKMDNTRAGLKTIQ